MLFIPLEIAKLNRDSARNGRGVFFIDGDQTLEPLGKSRRDETLKFSCLSSYNFMLLSKISYCNVFVLVFYIVKQAFVLMSIGKLHFQFSNCMVFVFLFYGV